MSIEFPKETTETEKMKGMYLVERVARIEAQAAFLNSNLQATLQQMTPAKTELEAFQKELNDKYRPPGETPAEEKKDG